MLPGDVNNDAENNNLNERPLDTVNVGATVNLGRDEEADISTIHLGDDCMICPTCMP